MTTPSASETAPSTAPAREHYERLLASVYGWMIGDRAAALEAGRKQLRGAGVGPARAAQRALDLGAGLGVHAIPLAELGYEVTAVDTSEPLLGELRAARSDVRTICADLLRAGEVAAGPFDVIVCMGDTLAHLASEEEVTRALAAASRLLADGGRLVLTFRDYVSRERHGTDRFLLVRADDARVMTCCLELEPAHVAVTDIVHERGESGWTMRASSYRKVRLARAWVEKQAADLGLTLERADEPPGWLMVVASKAAAR
jgi:SAM-dependent methyltransferase